MDKLSIWKRMKTKGIILYLNKTWDVEMWTHQETMNYFSRNGERMLRIIQHAFLSWFEIMTNFTVVLFPFFFFSVSKNYFVETVIVLIIIIKYLFTQFQPIIYLCNMRFFFSFVCLLWKQLFNNDEDVCITN